VCNGNGMCIADPSAGFVHCVCDEKFEGPYCSKEVVINDNSNGMKPHSDTGFTATIAVIAILLVVVGVAAVYLYRRNKTLEKYAVPILDEHEQVEPRVPDYSDDDSDEFPGTKRLGTHPRKEMVTVSTRISSKLSATRNKMRGKSKYQAHNYDDSESDDDDDYSDDDDGNNGPSAYLAANQDGSDTE